MAKLSRADLATSRDTLQSGTEYLLTGGAFQNSLLQLDKKSGDGDDNQTISPRGAISKAILNQLKEQHKIDLKAQMNKYLAEIKDLQDKNYDLKTNNMNLKRINHDYERINNKKTIENHELSQNKIKVKELEAKVKKQKEYLRNPSLGGDYPDGR